MPITERGRWTSSILDERGRRIFNGLTETGQLVFNITGVPANPTSTPSVTVISVDHVKISNKSGIDRAIVTFKFDTDVTSWSVNVMGTSQTTGTIAESGGAVMSGIGITATIDYSELYQEGGNRVNIYGQNSLGWTPYEQDPSASSQIVKDGLIGYYHADQGWSSSSWSNIAPSFNGNYNATPTGAVTKDATKGIYFNGESNPPNPPFSFMATAKNYYSLPAFNTVTSDIFEVEMYFQAPFGGTGTSMLPFGYQESNGSFGIAIKDNGTLTDMDGGTYTTLSANTVYKLNYVGNKTTNTEKLYINDSVIFNRVATAILTDIDTSGHAIDIGSLNFPEMGHSAPFAGYIKSLKIYSRELTSSERNTNTSNGISVGL
jgi:hypothetical protein